MKVLLERRLPEQQDVSKDVGEVEVYWAPVPPSGASASGIAEPRVELVTFPLPPEVKYLSDELKEKFRNTCDLSTAEKRCKQLLKAAPGFVQEMVQVHELAQRFPFYAYMQRECLCIECMHEYVAMAAPFQNVLVNISLASICFSLSEQQGILRRSSGRFMPLWCC
jgi:hypothetical protein